MRHRSLVLSAVLTLPLFLYAQKESDASGKANAVPAPALPADIPETDRLTQEYMAERAKWVAAREKSLREAAEAKDPAERKRLHGKREKEEQELRKAAAGLAKKLKEAEKAKRDSRSVKPSS